MQLDKHFEYEVAISFAGEQRHEAEAIAKILKDAGVTVFYDRDEKVDLWGKDLYVHLSEIYQHKAKYCILLASREYRDNVWTNHERQSAQARAVSEKGKDYLLPVRMDDTEIPGIPHSVGFLDYREEGADGVAQAFLRKTKKKIAQEAEEQKKHIIRGKGNFENEGPIVRVLIERPSSPEITSELRNSGLQVNALIDTGASLTVINPEIVRTCGLQPIGFSRISSPAHIADYPQYSATISFPESSLKPLALVPVVAIPIRGSSVSCLLGRNVLRRWRIICDGRTGDIEVQE
jgi:predicted aspartyl protease